MAHAGAVTTFTCGRGQSARRTAPYWPTGSLPTELARFTPPAGISGGVVVDADVSGHFQERARYGAVNAAARTAAFDGPSRPSNSAVATQPHLLSASDPPRSTATSRPCGVGHTAVASDSGLLSVARSGRRSARAGCLRRFLQANAGGRRHAPSRYHARYDCVPEGARSVDPRAPAAWAKEAPIRRPAAEPRLQNECAAPRSGVDSELRSCPASASRSETIAERADADWR